MSPSVKSILETLLASKWYWSLLSLLGFAMLGVALYYQYALGDEPCQVCIHIRIWTVAFTLLALLMAVLPGSRWLNVGGHGLAVGCMVGFYERSKYLYDVEKGFGDGSCEFFLGFPDWFALDRWLPFIFEVRNLCGLSPKMLWGLTMVESLLVMSIALLAVSAVALVFNFVRALNNRL